MGAELDEYLAILKASYDYDPQSDDEIAIKEHQLLFLVQKVDDDWWKVKIKGESQEDDSPVGLVPAAYVEQAEHISIVKTLYDYEAVAPGELTVKEDDILLVFETEQDWLLVQSQEAGGKAGFVPGNYVETYTGEEDPAPPAIVVPSSPARPVSTYVDPAVRVATAKVTADGIQTWSVSEIDKKGKKKKGTLGIGNGAVFFASESDKTPVQKWQTSDVLDVNSEKAKHVTIDIGGTTQITLHFHAGSKESVEAIISKLKSSKSLSDSSNAAEPRASMASDSPEVASPKKSQVHFSSASPVIIPAREDTDDEGEDEGPREDQTGPQGVDSHEEASYDGNKGEDSGVALYDFIADGSDELSIVEGESLVILERDSDEWWKCRNSSGVEGVVPASYIELSSATSKPASPAPYTSQQRDKDVDAHNVQAAAAERQAEAERLAREEEEELAQKARKKMEAQKRARDAAAAAEVERKRRQEAAAARMSPPPPSVEGGKKSVENGRASSSGRPSAENNRPPPERTRVWHDRSGQFRVEAAFLGFKDGKLRLHKVNGVIVEVPSEKMSIEDMQFVEKYTSKKSRPQPSKPVSDDDIPLGITRGAIISNPTRPTAPKKKSNIDWFDFFLSAGCDLDDCTRYAASFERDKIDESILPDITDVTMRSLGLREGDIIRVTKAIETRKPTDNLKKSSPYTEAQLRRDEELARQLQAQETGGSSRDPPNLFSGPGGVLKPPRRGRPQPSKSTPLSNVDLKAISTVSDQIQRTGSPQIASPVSVPPSSAAVVPPPRSSSALPLTSGFGDDAWTNRPSSTKPLVETPPAPPPASVLPAPAPPPAPPTAATPPPSQPTPTTSALPIQPSPTPLSKTTESDIFDQLSRLTELRKQSTPLQPPASAPPSLAPPNSSFNMGVPPALPLASTQVALPSQPSPQPFNAPRGPFAPVPANQSLLQPLIPTQTGAVGFIPTRPGPAISPFQGQLSQPMFLSSQPTGLPITQPMMSHPTGMPFGGGVQAAYHNQGAIPPLQTHFTGYNPNYNQSPFNNVMSPPPVPPVPQSVSSNSNNTSPANIFAQMKSGTFAADSNGVQPADKYDALRPNPLATQATGWGQPYHGGYMGYQH